MEMDLGDLYQYFSRHENSTITVVYIFLLSVQDRNPYVNLEL